MYVQSTQQLLRVSDSKKSLKLDRQPLPTYMHIARRGDSTNRNRKGKKISARNLCKKKVPFSFLKKVVIHTHTHTHFDQRQ